MTEIQFNEWINKYKGDKNGEYTSYLCTEDLRQFCKDYTKQKLTLTSVLKPFKGTEEDCFNRWLSDNGFYEDNGFYKKEYRGKCYKRLHLIDMYNEEILKP